jgi:hypothetical protein
MRLTNILLAAVLVAGVGATSIFVSGIDDIHQLQAYIGRRVMPDFTTTWTSDGMTVTVNTTIKDGETNAQAAARHRAKVDALLVQFPKDPA